MKKKLLMVLILAVTALALLPASAWAAPSAKTTTYEGVLKSGKTVYCASPGWGIYKATVKKGKVTDKKWLVKEKYGLWENSDLGKMVKKGGYLYFIKYTEGTVTYLSRVKISSGKTENIANNVTAYAIKKKKIYAQITNPDTGKKTYKVMKLDGSAKKKTPVKPVMKSKAGPKGYSVSYKKSKGYIKTYLKTPKGKYCLGKVESVE